MDWKRLDKVSKIWSNMGAIQQATTFATRQVVPTPKSDVPVQQLAKTSVPGSRGNRTSAQHATIAQISAPAARPMPVVARQPVEGPNAAAQVEEQGIQKNAREYATRMAIGNHLTGQVDLYGQTPSTILPDGSVLLPASIRTLPVPIRQLTVIRQPVEDLNIYWRCCQCCCAASMWLMACLSILKTFKIWPESMNIFILKIIC